MGSLSVKDIELIHKYLSDELSEAELGMFNDKLKEESFRIELMEQGRNLDSLKDYINEGFKDELKQTENITNSGHLQKMAPYKWLFLLLSLLVISFLAYFSFASKEDPVYLADKYFTPYPPETNVRGVENTTTFSQAMKDYANEDFKKAITGFSSINPKNENLEIYLACSYLKTNNFEAAFQTLNKIQVQPDDSEIIQNIEWFKVISLLGLDKKEEALALLNKIKNTDSHIFKSKANQLIKEL